jgi:hypothetical protein
MIPKSRRLNRGAYRDVVPNTIDGDIRNELFGTSVGNSLSTRLVNLTIEDSGDFNLVSFYKRKVSKKKPAKVYTVDMSLSMGSKNSGLIRLMGVEERDFSVSVDIKDRNILDFKTYDEDDIIIGSDNIIFGVLNTKTDGVVIGDGNFLVDFMPEIEGGSYVKGYPKTGSLMYETNVTAYAGVSQDYIEVADTNRMACNTEIIFGSVAAGFVRKNITGIIGNRVYLDSPLTAKESTFPEAMVFNEYYEILPAYESTLARPAERRTKRLFVSDNQSLHLRNVTIGGTFDTKVFFMRSADNMTIIKDLTPEEFPSGTSIIAREVNPYSAWIPSLVQDENTPEKYTVTGENKAFIGRSTMVGTDSYTVVAFTQDTITFSSELPDGTDSVYFGELDSEPSGSMVTSYVSQAVKGNSVSIPVEDSSKFFVGQTIKIEGMSTKGVISEIVDDELVLQDKLFDDIVENKFYVGLYELPISKNSARSLINAASADLHSFIFGEN